MRCSHHDFRTRSLCPPRRPPPLRACRARRISGGSRRLRPEAAVGRARARLALLLLAPRARALERGRVLPEDGRGAHPAIPGDRGPPARREALYDERRRAAKVLTPENCDEVLPRFFHLSKSGAKAVSAALRPNEAAPHRAVVTAVRPAASAAVLAAPVLAATAAEDPSHFIQMKLRVPTRSRSRLRPFRPRRRAPRSSRSRRT